MNMITAAIIGNFCVTLTFLLKLCQTERGYKEYEDT